MYAAISPSEPVPTLPRARGELRVTYVARDGVTRHQEAYQQGAMRVRFPRVTAGVPPEAVIINTSGGLTDGDIINISVTAEENAYGLITGQACERIYQSRFGEAEVNGRVVLADQARLDWVPQPTILFNEGRFRRMTQVDMAESATLLAVEGIIFGRTAMAEEVFSGWVEDGWRIRRGGKLVYADTLRITGSVNEQLASKAVLAGHKATASIIYVAPDAEQRLEEMRSLFGSDQFIAGASAWDGILSARVVAPTGAILTKALLPILSGFRKEAMPRVWTL